MDHQHASGGRKQAASSPEAAIASEVFDQFCNASTLKSILGYYRQLCEILNLRPNTINQFYPKLKSKLRSWKAQALWKKFDQRANHKCYNRGKACPNTRVLIIGGGPCGLRSAIEAQLLGAKVVVVEKRDRMSRNNVLHLWPFVIHDLRGLGAKKFFGKFCAGSIDHISIRQLQCILLKVALILGVEFHENVSFDSLVPPSDRQEEGKVGWRAKTTPIDHPVSQYEFDVLIGADGKRNTLEGFKRKEFRGKLAIAITANFINKRTEAEARVEEISGVAFIFNQKFFKELYQETGIDLENIVYYKDDTHYFVMTAKKHSLIDKGVICQDHADTAKLLAKENVDRDALMHYAREAAEFSTEYQMMDMEFAVNHYGQPDVAMFDFTSMYAAENASRVMERNGHRLLMILVGDSLLEPFWPTGSGCARGFLSSLDACWAIKGWGCNMTSPLEVIAERESIYRLLGQTTPENLNRDYAAYTLDPHTRYPNLNIRSVTPIQVRSLLDTDDPESIKPSALQSEIDVPKKRRRRDVRADSQVHPDTLLRWLQKQVALYDSVHIEDMGASFKSGLAICAIIHRYRPDLIDFQSLRADDTARNNQIAFDILEKELGIPPVMTGDEMSQCEIPDKLTMFSYLTQIYEVFRGEIPHVKHPKLEPENEENATQLGHLTPEQKAQLIGRIVKQDGTRTRQSRSRHSNENIQSHADRKSDTVSRRSRKRRSTEKMGATVEERQKRLEQIEKNREDRMKKRQYMRKMATQQFYKSLRMLQANAKRERDEPFEDYSIFLYRQTAPDFKDRVKYLEQKILYPDREPKMLAGHQRGSVDEEFSGRIKSIEDKLKGSTPAEKKPRDLLRAIGKIEKTDWNVKEIEKKIEENKMGRGVRVERVERVPKWSREQFLARQIKMEKKGHDQKESDSKYADIDNTLKSIGKKIKEGNVLGHNKVSAMAEQFSNKNQDTEPKVQKSSTKAAVVLPAQGGSEMCHFCNKRVYLMERLTAEGKFFHRGCFRCEYCSTSLRIGNHTFDRDKNGGRFYCTQHFGLTGNTKDRIEKKKVPVVNKENIPASIVNMKVPEMAKMSPDGISGLDLLDRGQTPERIEFENLARISDADEAHSQMDEDEWTDRNFGASTAELGSSDEISDMSDSDDDNEVYEEAIDQPLTTEGTLELAKNWTLRYSHSQLGAEQSDTGSNEYEDSSDEYTSEDDESGTATENEEDVRARELRKQEVWLKTAPRSSDTDTGSETEVKLIENSIDTVEQEMRDNASSLANDNTPSLPSDIVDGTRALDNVDENHQTITENSVNVDTVSLNTETILVSCRSPQNPSLNEANEANESAIPLSNSQNLTIDHPTDLLEKEKLLSSSNVAGNIEISSNDPQTDSTLLSRTNQSNQSNQSNSDEFTNLETNLSRENEISNDSKETITELNITNDTTDDPVDVNTRIALPDAIPLVLHNVEMANCDRSSINVPPNLPDLIVSSPMQSRPSSACSSESYRSIETSCDEFTAVSDVEFVEKDQNCDFTQKRNETAFEQELNARTKLTKQIECPIVTVTSPSPTNEKTYDELRIEPQKLTVPKEKSIIPKENQKSNTAYDKLKQDLRRRKANNKINMGELRPLSTEHAQLKMNKYFEKNGQERSRRNSPEDQENVEFRNTESKMKMKTKLSSKVKKEDMMKYFSKNTSREVDNKESESRRTSYDWASTDQEENEETKDVNEELYLFDLDKEFNEIEEMNGNLNIEDVTDSWREGNIAEDSFDVSSTLRGPFVDLFEEIDISKNVNDCTKKNISVEEICTEMNLGDSAVPLACSENDIKINNPLIEEYTGTENIWKNISNEEITSTCTNLEITNLADEEKSDKNDTQINIDHENTIDEGTIIFKKNFEIDETQNLNSNNLNERNDELRKFIRENKLHGKIITRPCNEFQIKHWKDDNLLESDVLTNDTVPKKLINEKMTNAYDQLKIINSTDNSVKANTQTNHTSHKNLTHESCNAFKVIHWKDDTVNRINVHSNDSIRKNLTDKQIENITSSRDDLEAERHLEKNSITENIEINNVIDDTKILDEDPSIRNKNKITQSQSDVSLKNSNTNSPTLDSRKMHTKILEDRSKFFSDLNLSTTTKNIAEISDVEIEKNEAPKRPERKHVTQAIDASSKEKDSAPRVNGTRENLSQEKTLSKDFVVREDSRTSQPEIPARKKIVKTKHTNPIQEAISSSVPKKSPLVASNIVNNENNSRSNESLVSLNNAKETTRSPPSQAPVKRTTPHDNTRSNVLPKTNNTKKDKCVIS